MRVLVFANGVTHQAEAVDPRWLAADASEVFWVDIEQPYEADRQLLSETFHFHELKSDIASLRRVTLPQRDVVSRLARREFPQISDALSYRFRDVHDHLVRLADEAVFLQDRVTGLLDAHISTQSHRLNQVMKVLTVIATIFMPLTVLTSMYGMNVSLPLFPGGQPAQFWWILGVMVASTAGMLWAFRRMEWL